jgi:thioredoxin reductase (NADPH)
VAVVLSPNSASFKDYIKCNKGGWIEVIDQTSSNIKGVFVAGDVHDYRYRQAVTAAGAGCMAALDAERYLSSFAEALADRSEIE